MIHLISLDLLDLVVFSLVLPVLDLPVVQPQFLILLFKDSISLLQDVQHLELLLFSHFHPDIPTDFFDGRFFLFKIIGLMIFIIHNFVRVELFQRGG
jgi:hypothetical protein